ncbi:MAG: hypothetical protein ACFCUM_13940 [Bacteroidales bacterium]
MKKHIAILIFVVVFTEVLNAQFQDNFEFRGQASGWFNANSGNTPVWLGARYIPQITYRPFQEGRNSIDFEVSANINGSTGFQPAENRTSDGTIKPYRIWGRYTTSQFEIRMGLQKINFGSAAMLRPLMWFDQVDPRDPLQLTDGVWGVLARYYFINNVNIWLWGLYGNDGPKTWEILESASNVPELGGRLQIPVPRGETALSFHHRKATATPLFGSGFMGTDDPDLLTGIPENRLGFDGKWDIEIGLWIEGSYIRKSRNTGIYTNQQILNLGADYTFGIGNGLNVIFEQLLFSYDQNAFAFRNNHHFTSAALSYPLGIFDNINTIIYHDWTNGNIYTFLNWQRQYNRVGIYAMAFWNPDTIRLPQQSEGAQMFSGRGFQLMLVFNH